MTEDVSHLTGENEYRKPKNINLNEVRFNGQTGRFTYVNLLERKDGEKAVQEDLGENIKAVFLKLRRRIGGYKKDIDAFYVSTEHNNKNDVVYLFGAKEKGVAEDLYEKYKPVLKAQRVIYAYLLREGKDRELVRIVVKGASLMPDREEQEHKSTSLTEYVGREKPKDEHTYMFVTNMQAVEKKSPLGRYFAIDFSQGPRLPADKLDVVVEEIKRLAQNAQEQDNYYKEAPQVEIKEALPTIEYPTEDIDIDDIPF